MYLELQCGNFALERLYGEKNLERSTLFSKDKIVQFLENCSHNSSAVIQDKFHSLPDAYIKRATRSSHDTLYIWPQVG
jgi:hypothetical protein